MSGTARSWASVLRKRPDLVTREIAGETIVVPVKGDLAGMQQIFTLNAVGACVWGAINGSRSLGEIRDIVLERFDAPAPEVEADLLEFLDRVEEEGLAEAGP